MANRFIGGVLSSKPQANSPFVSRATTGTYFNSSGVLSTASVNQPRINYTYDNGSWRTPSLLIEPAATNLMTYSEQFDNTSGWSNKPRISISANATTAPDGNVTADKLVEDTSAGYHYLNRSFTVTANSPYTASVYAKAAGRNWISVNIYDSVNRIVWFNLATGIIGSTESTCTASMIPVGNGWYRCIVSRLPTQVSIGVENMLGDRDGGTSSGASYTGDGTSGVYLWGIQFEAGYTATSYIPTTTTTITRSADIVGTYSTGVYSLEDQQNNTANDDQYTVTSFTTTGSSSWVAPIDVTQVEVLVVAGGGGGGHGQGGAGGGGGAGGLIYNPSYPVTPGQTYPILVGAGGAGGTNASPYYGTNGNNSQFGNLIAIGGGAGAGKPNNGKPGGSGGGAGKDANFAIGGAGVAGQGYSGGGAPGLSYYQGGGGGGAGGPGVNSAAAPNGTAQSSAGGPGLYFNISGTSTAYAGGGGGGDGNGTTNFNGVGGSSIGGTGGASSPASAGTAGTTNTGSGGGGGGTNSAGGAGGSGIVIVKYKRTPKQISATSNAAIVVQRFTSSVTGGWTAPAGVTSVEALVVAGGGGGGVGGGGGGGGGLVYNSAFTVTPGTSYTVTVGAGGAGVTVWGSSGAQGSNSVFGSITATGGGGGLHRSGTTTSGLGGSGGGDAGGSGVSPAGATPYVLANSTAGQGFPGGRSLNAGFTTQEDPGGGGGGAGGPGADGGPTTASGTAGNSSNPANTSPPGKGGPGLALSITGTTEYYAGGGGGANRVGTGAPGGVGGGAAGGISPLPGAPNTGGGGGGSGYSGYSGGQVSSAGGSGVVVLRYRVPTIATFLDSGSWTCPAGITSVQALIVAGGGAGAIGGGGGGGGAGGVIYSTSVAVTPGVTYPVVVGAGGSSITGGPDVQGTSGQNSSFAGLVAVGGGKGAANGKNADVGGSGGGGYGVSVGLYANGIQGQGNAGSQAAAASTGTNGGGGGGAGAQGGSGSSSVAGAGGIGLAYSISGSSTYYGGGGGGGGQYTAAGAGGTGGGGNGGGAAPANGTAGTANTGGGGGGAGFTSASVTSGAGGSGIVIIRWSGA